MDKKYKLEREDGFYRIIALRDIPRHRVEVGDKGGRVSGEHNLRYEGNCWIRHDALVCDDAIVRDSACVRDHARVCGEAVVRDDAFVWGNVIITDNVIIRDNAIIRGFDHAQTNVGGTAVINGTTCIDSGTWMVTPKVIHGSMYDVIYNDKQIAIGCECHPLEWWEENGLEVAENDEFTPEQIEEYREYLDAIEKECADDKEV